MEFFSYRDQSLHAENVPVSQIAETFGTPVYIYSRAALTENFRAYSHALADTNHLICYAVKANSSLAVLNILARLGAGFDIVSGGELQRVIAAGGDPAKVVFSGVGKQQAEMRQALEAGIYCFNVESEAELTELQEVAATLGCQAPVSLRVNPDVDAKTHPYISTGLRENKFGVDILHARTLYQKAQQMPNINIKGIDCHIGSQLTQLEPFIDALDRLLVLLDQLQSDGIKIDHLDLGGGLGICYQDEQVPSVATYIDTIRQHLGQRNLKLLLEPGRSIAANAGILLTRVERLKQTETRHFAVVDAAMNDLLRPSLYKAWQRIIPVQQSNQPTTCFDIVGPICETGDYLGKSRELALTPGDLLAVCDSGAYGFTMSSNYNTRPRAAEVMVDDCQTHEIRRRETLAQLLAGESVLPE